MLNVGLLQGLGVTWSNNKRAREVSGVEPENGEEELGVQMNLGEKLSLEKARINVLNVYPSLFPNT